MASGSADPAQNFAVTVTTHLGGTPQPLILLPRVPEGGGAIG